MKKIVLILIFLCGILYGNVGKITAIKGDVFIDRGGKSFKANSGIVLELKDKVVTKDQSRALILMNDKTSITVGKNSTIIVSEYVFDENVASNNKAEFNFAQGVFRTITGKIGKLNKSNFKIKAKSASIGIRGTVFDVAISKEFVKVGVIDGAIVYENIKTGQQFEVPKGKKLLYDDQSGKTQLVQGSLKESKEVDKASKELKKEAKKLEDKQQKKEDDKKETKEKKQKIKKEDNEKTKGDKEEEEKKETVVKKEEKKVVEETKEEKQKETIVQNKEDEQIVKETKEDAKPIDSTKVTSQDEPTTLEPQQNDPIETVALKDDEVVMTNDIDNPEIENQEIENPQTQNPELILDVEDTTDVANEVTNVVSNANEVVDEIIQSNEQTKDEILDDTVNSIVTVVDETPSNDLSSNIELITDKLMNQSSDTYLEFGYIANQIDGELVPSNEYYLSGDLTPTDVIEQYILENKTFNYSGGISSMVNEIPSSGNIDLDIDFGSQTFSGSLYVDQGSWEASINSGSLNPDGFSSTDITGSSEFGVIDSGNLGGKFYGPSVDSVGGSFELNSGTNRVNGVFGASQTTQP